MAKKQKEEEKIELELDPIENKAEEAEIQIENAEDPPSVEVKAEEPAAENGITTDDGIKQLRLQLEPHPNLPLRQLFLHEHHTLTQKLVQPRHLYIIS